MNMNGISWPFLSLVVTLIKSKKIKIYEFLIYFTLYMEISIINKHTLWLGKRSNSDFLHIYNKHSDIWVYNYSQFIQIIIYYKYACKQTQLFFKSILVVVFLNIYISPKYFRHFFLQYPFNTNTKIIY